MPTLQEEFEAYKATQQESAAFQLEQDYAAYKRDMAQGGSIRQAPIEPNLPIGSTVGAIAGSLTNPMLVPIFSAGGEAAQQLVEHALGSPAAPQTTGEAALRMGREAALSTVAEGVGRTVGKMMHGGAFARHLDPAAQRAEAYLESRGLQGGLLPAELTTTRILDIAHNISEYSLLGGGAIKKFKSDREAFFRDLADEMIDRFGPRMSADDTGRAVIDATKRNLELGTLPAKLIYNAIERDAAPTYYDAVQRMKVQRAETPITKSVVDRETVKKIETKGKPSQYVDEDAVEPSLRGLKVKTTFQDIQVGERLEHLKVMTTTQERQLSGARIDLAPLKEELAGMIDVARRSGGLADREMGNTLLKFIADKPDMVSYPVAKAIRTEVRTLKETLQQSVEAKNAPAIGKANSVYGKLTDAIREGLKDHDPFVADMWDQANAIERAGHQSFNNRIVRSIVRRGNIDQGGKPEAIADAVWQKNNATVIGKVRAAVDIADWKKMQSVYMQRLFERAADEHGVPQAKKLEQLLYGPSGLGERAIEAGFDKATSTELKSFINALQVAQDKQAEGTGRMLIQLKQGGAFLEITGAALSAVGAVSSEYGAPEVLAGGGILLTPFLLGHIMTAPSGITWLTKGFTTMAKAPQAASLAAQIVAASLPRTSVSAAVPTAEQIPSREPLNARPQQQ